jgi:hypothetical protein
MQRLLNHVPCRRLIALCALALLLGGCVTAGPTRLRADQVEYERALGDAKKREMLATIIGLRYGDSPSFVAVSQIIAAYNFDVSGGPTLNLSSGATPSFAQASGTATYANHPTFTFTPVTGDAYASAYIRPLPATLVLPLAESGIPIDLLLRLAVQSVGGLQNGTPLGGPNSDGTPGFFELLRALRSLQLAGELNFQYKEVDKVPQVTLTLGGAQSDQPATNNADIATVQRLLHLSPKAHEYTITESATGATGTSVTMVTRSVLGILSNLGSQIEVPEDAIRNGSTKPTVRLIGGETRPTVVVHVGEKAPAGAYVTEQYGGASYWIERNDFDSKYAFTVVQNLIALAEANQDAKTPIVTIPAG